MRAAVLLLAVTGCLASPAEGGADGAAPLTCADNLVENGSFEEQGTAGWVVSFGTAEIVQEGFDGAQAVQVCHDGEAGDPFFSFDDMPGAVPEPAMGEMYELEASVRALDLAPNTMEVVVREWDVDGNARPVGTSLSPSAAWSRVTASLTVQSDQAQLVDVYVASADVTPGVCFQLDAICLRRIE
jgi:hypothetical protein